MQARPAKPFTRAGAAEAIGWSRRQIDRAIDLGEIRNFSFAGRLWIPAAEVERLKLQFR